MYEVCFEMIKCPICGKEFVKNINSVYKVENSRRKYVYACSYSCHNKLKEKYEKKRTRKYNNMCCS